MRLPGPPMVALWHRRGSRSGNWRRAQITDCGHASDTTGASVWGQAHCWGTHVGRRCNTTVVWIASSAVCHAARSVVRREHVVALTS